MLRYSQNVYVHSLLRHIEDFRKQVKIVIAMCEEVNTGATFSTYNIKIR